MTDQPKVIIRCLVYNHERFLRDCLDGFVMQRTNFPFKAVVHDDCSTDSSAAIIREYAEKYPDIIEPIYEKENLYSKRDGSLRQAMDKATLNRSPYVAYCEGDDFWIDPDKLQKQVDYLDTHPDVSMCFSACQTLAEDGLSDAFEGKNVEDRFYSASELMAVWRVPTASICLRSDILQDPRMLDPKRPTVYGDIIVILTAAHHGKVRGMKERMTTYRINRGGVTRNPAHTLNIARRRLGHYQYIAANFPLVDKKLMNHFFFGSQCGLLLCKGVTIREKCIALYRLFKFNTFQALIMIFYHYYKVMKRGFIKKNY